VAVMKAQDGKPGSAGLCLIPDEIIKLIVEGMSQTRIGADRPRGFQAGNNSCLCIKIVLANSSQAPIRMPDGDKAMDSPITESRLAGTSASEQHARRNLIAGPFSR
jgi:hypothetical protein